jgi:predicted RNase H-like nuclease
VYEVHPELSLAVLLGAPAAAPKKSWAGMAERRRALNDAGLNLDDVRGEAATRAGVDDMLDAAVAAWSARRVLDGCAVIFPESAPMGPGGRPVAIWA